MPAEFRGDLRDVRALAPRNPGVMRKMLDERKAPANRKPRVNATLTPNLALAPMPGPTQSFNGLTNLESGGSFPSDVNGDVGPNHYVESVNSAYAVFSKTGTRLGAFTEDALWKNVGTSPCNGSSQGDPVVLYDRYIDRWYLTHFAFGTDSKNQNVAPFYECIAVSQTGNPLGNYWLYAIRMDPGGAGFPPQGTFADYPKFGIWSDGCLYMATNEYKGDDNAGTVAASFNRADMAAGAPVRYGIVYIPNSTDPFTMIPSNLLGTNLPPAGTPNYFVSETQTGFAWEVRKFTPGPNCGGGGTLGNPVRVSQQSYFFPDGDIVSQPNTSGKLDSLPDRLMQKVQYRRIGNTESLWVVHNVQASSSSPMMPQWAQINVTGGTVQTTPVQEQIYGSGPLHRWGASLAVDQAGNMAMGYSTSSGSVPNFPSIAYSGRLATDPLNQLPQTETQLVAGAASQIYTNDGEQVSRWGDYTSMSIDPADDCTFWYVNQYYSSQTNATLGNWSTRIGSFKFPNCAGVSGTGNPTPVSISPPVASGNTMTLTAVFSAPGGFQTLDVVNLLINNALDGRQACYLAYSRPSNTLYIVPDNGDATQITGKVMDGFGVVGNNQCVVTLAGSTVTGSSNTLQLVLNLSFASSFTGNKVIYAAARDTSQRNSGWQTMGVHGILPVPLTFPNPVGLAPAFGNTSLQTISFSYDDATAATNLQTVWALINTAIDGRGACYVAYYRPGNQLYLYPDNGDGTQAQNIFLGANNTISNSQCSITAQGASVQTSGNRLTVTLPITFKSAFAGFKGVWLAAQTLAGTVSPWQALGAEVIP